MIILLEEGSILPCDEATFTALRSHVEAGKAFDAVAQGVLATNKEGAPVLLTAVHHLKELIARGDALGHQIPSLLKLFEVLMAHETWEAKIQEIMAAGERT
jgi:hypothetical protein